MLSDSRLVNMFSSQKRNQAYYKIAQSLGQVFNYMMLA